MNLNLSRPLAFIDLETTGVNVGSDRIVEISILKLNPDGSKNVRTERINPGIPIPAESSAVHGIHDEDVKDQPSFADRAKNFAIFLHDSDLAGYNSNKFDIPLLVEEFLRAGVQFDMKERYAVDVQNIFHKMEQRTLQAAFKFYCDKELVNAHSAEADITATHEILEAQLDRYPELSQSVEELAEFSRFHKSADLMGRLVYDKNDEIVFNFGKYKGQSVRDIFIKEASYYFWMMKGDFPLSTKQTIKEIFQSIAKK